MLLLGERVKKMRKEKGMTQQELADKIFVTKVSICGYEKETRNPNLETLLRLADELNIGIDYLMGRDFILKEKDIVLSNDDIEILKMIKEREEVYKFLKKERNIRLLSSKIRKKNGFTI